jgi:hypothetical protein
VLCTPKHEAEEARAEAGGERIEKREKKRERKGKKDKGERCQEVK